MCRSNASVTAGLLRCLALLTAIATGDSAAAAEPGSGDEKPDAAGWTSDFSSEKSTLVSTGRNPFFILEPGYQLILEGGNERLVITVLNDTRTIDGVETRVVEERESKRGKVVEVSRNFFAICQRTSSVYYFGEEVDDFKDGKVVGHHGAWLAGERGAQFGLMMPGLPLLHARYYQELAPGAAMDRAEIVSLTAVLKTPAGVFERCLKSEETTPLEPGEREAKHYAPGIGLIQDGAMKLVSHGPAK
ncbi:MAG: hypothetical protein K2Y37_14620 [Pirellulales bacterium]|nr:hypothetical protein [Pirellulales bacterium]